jgi:Cof subfamily protein (haloacid dehalogenase superfamily)
VVENQPLSQNTEATTAARTPIKLVAIDLDGTLLTSQKKVSEQTVSALRCVPADLRVVIASARPPRSVRHIYHELGLQTWQINYNGAMIWDEPAGQVVFHRPMRGELVHRIVATAREMFDQILVSCEVLDRWFTDRADQSFTTETGRMFKPDVISPIHEICTQEITKLMLLGPPELLSSLQTPLREQYGDAVTILQTDRDLLQIMDNRVGKASALKRVAQHYNVPLKQVMAIGDAPNDVGMLQLAGVAVAMDNAHERVKQVAHWIAPSNDDHGVHAAMVRYGLCG